MKTPDPRPSPKAGRMRPNTRLSNEERHKRLDDFGHMLVGLVASAGYRDAPDSSSPFSVGEKPAYYYMSDYVWQPPVLDQYWRAKPGSDVVNGATGEITIVPEPVSYRGGDLTIKQMAQHLQLGPRQARATLAALGILGAETEAKMIPMVTAENKTKPEYSERLRLSEWSVKMGYGRRVRGGTGHRMDWLTPTGIVYIDGMVAFPEAVRDADEAPSPQMRPKAIEVIRRLLEVNPSLRQSDIVRQTGYSKMTVYRNRLLLSEVTSPAPSVI